MDASQVPTLYDILADYIDVDDTYYDAMIDALREREQILKEDYAERFCENALKATLANLRK
jgi:hypothetical protein